MWLLSLVGGYCQHHSNLHVTLKNLVHAESIFNHLDIAEACYVRAYENNKLISPSLNHKHQLHDIDVKNKKEGQSESRH